jgi:spore maturation protein SpmB
MNVDHVPNFSPHEVVRIAVAKITEGHVQILTFIINPIKSTVRFDSTIINLQLMTILPNVVNPMS